MEFLKEYQLDIMLFLSGTCAALSLLVVISKAIPKNKRRALMLMEIGSLILLLADRCAYIYRGDMSFKGYVMVRICNYLVFSISLFIIFSFNLVLRCLEEGRKKRDSLDEKLLRLAEIITFLGQIMLIVSLFTGWYYTIDAHNRYQRGPGILFCYFFPLATLIIQFIIIIRLRKTLTLKMMIPLVLFSVCPIFATIAQLMNYGVSLTNISIVGIAMLLYIFSLIDINEKLEVAQITEIRLLKEEQEKMQMMFEQTAAALANSIDAKDEYTRGHSERVAKYSEILARRAGKSYQECKEIYYAALLHDVGKIGVPDYIINKPGRLTEEEYETIKKHTVIGSQILSSISSTEYLSVGARYHHERYDGKGYPEGLKGKEIPELARIISVADAYDTMTSKRSYRDPLKQSEVRNEILKCTGTQFDPVYARIMLELIDSDIDFVMREKLGY